MNINAIHVSVCWLEFNSSAIDTQCVGTVFGARAATVMTMAMEQPVVQTQPRPMTMTMPSVMTPQGLQTVGGGHMWETHALGGAHTVAARDGC